jgi:hypothetical protein
LLTFSRSGSLIPQGSNVKAKDKDEGEEGGEVWGFVLDMTMQFFVYHLRSTGPLVPRDEEHNKQKSHYLPTDENSIHCDEPTYGITLTHQE